MRHRPTHRNIHERVQKKLKLADVCLDPQDLRRLVVDVKVEDDALKKTPFKVKPQY